MMQGKSIKEGHIQQGNKKLNEKRIHPTQKPVLLYNWILQKYAKAGDTILDTHGGSMSIAIACGELDYNIDIWEKDKSRFELAVDRVLDHFNDKSRSIQTSLFEQAKRPLIINVIR